MKKKTLLLFGLLIGLINSIIGAGGGMVAVPLLKKSGLNQNEAQASAISITLPLTMISAAMYLFSDYVQIADIYPYVIWGAIGAVVGAMILPKIPAKHLKKIFGVFMIYAGVRMMLR